MSGCGTLRSRKFLDLWCWGSCFGLFFVFSFVIPSLHTISGWRVCCVVRKQPGDSLIIWLEWYASRGVFFLDAPIRTAYNKQPWFAHLHVQNVLQHVPNVFSSPFVYIYFKHVQKKDENHPNPCLLRLKFCLTHTYIPFELPVFVRNQEFQGSICSHYMPPGAFTSETLWLWAHHRPVPIARGSQWNSGEKNGWDVG